MNPYPFTPEVYYANLQRHIMLIERAREEGDMDALKRESRGARDASLILQEMACRGLHPVLYVEDGDS